MRMYTIFDLIDAFEAKREDEKKRQRTVHIDPEDREKVLDMFSELDQPLNSLKQTTRKDADGAENIVLELGFVSTGERYGEIKARLEMAGFMNKGKAKEVETESK